jgi:hypothetical protein
MVGSMIGGGLGGGAEGDEEDDGLRQPLLVTNDSGKNNQSSDNPNGLGCSSTASVNFKKILSSQNTLALLRSKLSILDSTAHIISEQIESLKLSSSYALKVKDKLRSAQYESNLLNLKPDYVKNNRFQNIPLLNN